MKHRNSKLDQLKHLIDTMPVGHLFVASDFQTVDNTAAIHVYIIRLVKQGYLIKQNRGLYQKPNFNPRLNTMIAPSLLEIAETIARNNNWTIIPSGEAALNGLGLSTQIPNTLTFVSTGPNKTYTIHNRKIVFKHSFRTHELMSEHRKVAIAFQALRTLGKSYRHEINLQRFARMFTKDELFEFNSIASKSTRWIAELTNELLVYRSVK